jgi:transposase-like protein
VARWERQSIAFHSRKTPHPTPIKTENKAPRACHRSAERNSKQGLAAASRILRRYGSTIANLAGKASLNCHCCSGPTKKFGRFHNKNRLVQRFRCTRCGKTFSESQPLEGVRVETSKAVQVVHLLCEGMGIRAAARLSGLDEGTILNILETAGEHCARLLDARIRDVQVESVQADEMFAFVYCKQYNNVLKDPAKGEQYTFLAIDRGSKLILSHYVGKRTGESTDIFVADLRKRIKGHAQVTTDGLQSLRRRFHGQLLRQRGFCPTNQNLRELPG